ncbi:MAG: DegT/DnrJ/EryC1/StrS family aminotransferase [Ilumatobacteraceae bacterium]
MIPISTVQLGPEVEAAVLEVLRSGIIAQGPKVAALEAAFAALCQVPHAVAVNNGTTALVAAFEALGVQAGDEVVTSPFTFVATVNAALEAGATVRFADIRDDDFCLDATTVEPALTNRTTVLAPVHLYGQCADMEPIAALAQAHGLAIVEDAAQAHGATFGGRPAGSWGVATFSFYATKNIATGEGGMVTTADDAVADRLRVLRNQGMRQRYVYEIAGHNWRMTDLQAALALPQMATYDAAVAARRANASTLSAGLADVPGLTVPSELPGRGHVWHQYTVRVGPDAAISRDALIDALTADGIGCGIYYPRVIGDYDCYRVHPRVIAADTPVARRVATEVVSLPVHPYLTAPQLDQIVDAVRRALHA